MARSSASESPLNKIIYCSGLALVGGSTNIAGSADSPEQGRRIFDVQSVGIGCIAQRGYRCLSHDCGSHKYHLERVDGKSVGECGAG